ncbi:hypothetical protein JNUCC0626_07035 [Lentzea sp. JNUCC 0626]
MRTSCLLSTWATYMRSLPTTKLRVTVSPTASRTSSVIGCESVRMSMEPREARLSSVILGPRL